MRVETVEIPANARSIATPGISTGEQLIAMFLVPGSGDVLTFSQAKPVPISAIENGRMKISTEQPGPYSAVFFISSRTGMMVKRPAVGAESFVSTTTIRVLPRTTSRGRRPIARSIR
jgi:hypothetical protein